MSLPHAKEAALPPPTCSAVDPYEVRIGGVKADPYRIARAYGITDPVIFQALKKLLRFGRKHKDGAKDVREAITSLERWGHERRRRPAEHQGEERRARRFRNRYQSNTGVFSTDLFGCRKRGVTLRIIMIKSIIRTLLAALSGCLIMHGSFLIHPGFGSLVAGFSLYWATCLIFAKKPLPNLEVRDAAPKL
jgi:hypothetical protein